MIFVVLGLIVFAIAFVIVVLVAPFSVKKEIEDDQNISLADDHRLGDHRRRDDNIRRHPRLSENKGERIKDEECGFYVYPLVLILHPLR